MTRVLVTGATGFVGRGVLEPLVARGFEVHAVSSRGPLDGAPDGVRWHTADLLDAAARERAVVEAAPQQLLHLAWYAEPGRFWTSAENLRWVAASAELLRLAVAGGVARVVMAGTCAEYGWQPRTHCVEGQTPLEPATLYGSAKHALHLLAAAFCAQQDVSFAWGRVFFIYGPHEDPRRLVGSVAKALVDGRPAPTSHGEQIRDFLYAPDLADAFVALLDSAVGGPVNLASGRPVSLREVVEAVADAAGQRELLQLGALPANPSEPAELTADVTRLTDEVGWTPTRSLPQAAAETVAWWRAQETGA